ncbi:MAG TPA: alpha/beta hydrolase [Myxococcales bacterium]|nr:alpha/beta hydrolase [Myxococcales bacterium]
MADTLQVGAHRLESSWEGDPSPRALVLLHEGLGSVGLWRDFPRKLAGASGLPVFAYSRPNYGRSSASAPLPRSVGYMHDEALLLPEVLRAAGIREAVLFGHSDGASIALLHAAAQPVRGLVLEAPHVFAEELSLESIAKAREAYEKGDLRARLSRWHDDVDAAFWGWNGPWLHPGFRGWNLTGCLPSIAAPALLIQGGADEYGTMAQIEAIQRGLRGRTETLLLPGAGHSPHRDRESEVLSATADFVRSIT